jgi:hypothetical protein
MQYRAGTVSVTSNSSTVRGDGTAWTAAVEPGAMLVLSGERASYTVASVPSDTEVVLSAPYQGVTRAGASYWITTSFTPLRGYPVPEPGDVDAVLVIARAIQEIDADIPSTGGGVRLLDDLQDVAVSGASNGQVLTRFADGSWGPGAAGGGSVDGANVGTGGATVFKQRNGSTLEFRRLKANGSVSIAENPDDVTITVPAPGEANTASNAGSGTSVGVFARKSGANLEFRGIRPGVGITVTQDANDVVVSATGAGTPGGEANTASNVGTGAVQLFRQKSGADLQFRTLSLEAARFATTLSADGTSYSVTFRPPALSDLAGVLSADATPGQYLRRSDDGTWRGSDVPPAGLAALVQDPAPRLGNDLETNGRRILGLPGVVPGLVGSPEAKDYVLVLGTPADVAVTSVRTRTASGTVAFQVRAGGVVVGSDAQGAGGLAGTASATPGEAVVSQVIPTPAGSELSLTLSNPSADCADLAFAIYYRTA